MKSWMIQHARKLTMTELSLGIEWRTSGRIIIKQSGGMHVSGRRKEYPCALEYAPRPGDREMRVRMPAQQQIRNRKGDMHE